MTLYEDLKQAEVSVTLENDTDIKAEFCFKNETDLFKGHFPEMPILPGIMQLEMVKFGVEKATGCHYTIKSVRKTKFSGQIHPGDSVKIEISLTHKKEQLSVKALLKTDNKTVGKSNLTLVPVNNKQK